VARNGIGCQASSPRKASAAGSLTVASLQSRPSPSSRPRPTAPRSRPATPRCRPTRCACSITYR
jgi:hypothetical protein